MSFNIHTFKKVIAGKSALLMMFFLAQAVSALADTKLYMEDFSIAVGETKEVALILNNDKDATAIQAKLELPAGLTYVDGSVAKTSRVAGRGADVQASTTTGKLVIVETGGTIAAGEGAIITLSLTREAGLLDGEHEITISDIVVSDANGDQLNNEEQAIVNVKALGLGDCFFSAAENLEVAVGKEYQVDVNLTNSGVENLSALEGKLTLPEGLEIVPGEDGTFIYSDRTPAPMEFKFQVLEGTTTFVLSSSSNKTIEGTEGVIFSFKVKVTDKLAENTEIVLSGLRVAAVTGQSADAADVKISVTNTTVADKAAFAEYQAEQAAAIAALAEDGDSEASQAIIAAAVAAVEALEYDAEMTLEENLAAIDNIVEPVAEALAAQREEDNKIVPGAVTGGDEVTDADFDKFLEDLLNDELPEEGDTTFALYDANGDGDVDIADLQAILNMSNGLNWDGSQPDSKQ